MHGKDQTVTATLLDFTGTGIRRPLLEKVRDLVKEHAPSRGVAASLPADAGVQSSGLGEMRKHRTTRSRSC